MKTEQELADQIQSLIKRFNAHNKRKLDYFVAVTDSDTEEHGIVSNMDTKLLLSLLRTFADKLAESAPERN